MALGLGVAELFESLQTACTAHFGAPGVVKDLVRLSGGASQETYRFDFVMESGAGSIATKPLILRKDAAQENPANDRATEYALMRVAFDHGIPVPRQHFWLRFAEDETGFVMDRLEGETIPRRILRDSTYAVARARLTAQCAEVLARIHALPRESLPPLPEPGEPLALRLIDEQRARLDSFGDPHPVFELALRFLSAHLPAPRPLTLVHGDFRNGNLIVNEQGLHSVLDWELAHLGDPLEDLGWLCVKSWRFGAQPPVGGFGSREELFAAYSKASGSDVDAESVRFWEVFGTLKWGLICKLQAEYHLRGVKPSLELAALGRRVCETEYDLLLLLE